MKWFDNIKISLGIKNRNLEGSRNYADFSKGKTENYFLSSPIESIKEDNPNLYNISIFDEYEKQIGNTETYLLLPVNCYRTLSCIFSSKENYKPDGFCTYQIIFPEFGLKSLEEKPLFQMMKPRSGNKIGYKIKIENKNGILIEDELNKVMRFPEGDFPKFHPLIGVIIENKNSFI